MTAPSYPRRDWTPDEIERFKALYPTSSTNELVRRFRRSPSSLFQKASLLGLRRRAKPAEAAPVADQDEPAPQDPAAPHVLDTVATLHGTKTTYRTPAGATVTRHTLK